MSAGCDLLGKAGRAAMNDDGPGLDCGASNGRDHPALQYLRVSASAEASTDKPPACNHTGADHEPWQAVGPTTKMLRMPPRRRTVSTVQDLEHRILENRPVHGEFQNAEEISDSSCTGVSGTEKRRYADSDIA
jgi:hypothetical protein